MSSSAATRSGRSGARRTRSTRVDEWAARFESPMTTYYLLLGIVVMCLFVVGTNAAKMAMGLGAKVTILDVLQRRLAYLDELFFGKLTTMMSSEANLRDLLPDTDLLIGGVLIPGAKAPHLVTRDMLPLMPEGSVSRMIAAGRKAPRGDDIVLRRASAETRAVHGTEVASEALLPLDLGPGRRPALLVMGSLDPTRFSPAHGTDLLRFFAQAFRLVLIGWLRE
mgnify:CR=1 FL=1